MLNITLLFPSVLALMLGGLVLAVRRMKLGFAVLGFAALAYCGLMVAIRAIPLNPWVVGTLVLMVGLVAFGLGLEAISERLHLRMGWLSQDIVWGGLIGGMIVLFFGGGALMMLIGTLAGTVFMQLRREIHKYNPRRAFLDGFEAFYAMFGADGLRVVLAVVVADLFLIVATPHALY